jgi:hypothetical protein
VWSSAPVHLLVYGSAVAADALTPVLTAWLTKLIVDGLVEVAAGTESAAELVGPAIALAGVGVAAAALPQGTGFLGGEIGRRVVLDTTDRLFAATVRLPGLRPFEDLDFLDRLRMAQQGRHTAPTPQLTSHQETPHDPAADGHRAVCRCAVVDATSTGARGRHRTQHAADAQPRRCRAGPADHGPAPAPGADRGGGGASRRVTAVHPNRGPARGDPALLPELPPGTVYLLREARGRSLAP